MAATSSKISVGSQAVRPERKARVARVAAKRPKRGEAPQAAEPHPEVMDEEKPQWIAMRHEGDRRTLSLP